LSIVTIVTFLTQNLAFAYPASDTLSTPAGSDKIYRQVVAEMEARFNAHNVKGSIDYFLEQDRADGTEPEVEFQTILDLTDAVVPNDDCGYEEHAEEALDQIVAVLSASGLSSEDINMLLRNLGRHGIKKIQFAVTKDENADLTSFAGFEGEEVRAHVSTEYMTFIVRPSELKNRLVKSKQHGDVPLGLWVAAKFPHETRARSDEMEKAVDKPDITPDGARSVMMAFEDKNIEIEGQIIANGKLTNPEDVTKLSFGDTLSPMGRDLTSTEKRIRGRHGES